MRLKNMNRMLIAFAGIALALPAVGPLVAQSAEPPNTGNSFKDTSMIKPPAGQKIAIYEFEDLECPACGRAHPMVLKALDHYKLAFIRKDYPLPIHVWSTDAAIWARYLQDKVSPSAASDYRTAVFAAQLSIASKDDLMGFTRRYFQQHGLQMPFVVDPAGEFRKEVFADKAVGDRMGLTQTPTLFVCTQHEWVQVTDPAQLFHAIDEMETQVRAGH
jgi:protein-disulfide isomerase